MAKRAQCDRCDKLADLDKYHGTIPAGWVTIDYDPEPRKYHLAQHFCSISCALDWLADQVPGPDLEAVDEAMKVVPFEGTNPSQE